jgi:PIN domain nuclease of toxin-antitoxin system
VVPGNKFVTSLLLDTATFLWVIEDNHKLSKKASQALFSDDVEQRYLSHISLIEIVIKYSKGKLALPAPPHDLIEEECAARDIALLPLDTKAIYLLEKLPHHHNDPFDRLLVCQALARNMTFITPDTFLKKYRVKTVW